MIRVDVHTGHLTRAPASYGSGRWCSNPVTTVALAGVLIVVAVRMFGDVVVSTPTPARSTWRHEHGLSAVLEVDAAVAEGPFNP
jgi:hypothetical protein